ncbi:glucose-6-phosphate dehydrogenase assembly protein OpcA [Yimella sp. NH-Cas1]|uniref:glucose-6-phosphate dehydrogenase assembly protein OpcA n=1 Tax=Yimella sp. NH-Cas1 TaxID=2917726 RepID=UPI001EFA6BDB|nr:glucose-6-phosphate dehydrogenase assembly protein OpcA [Yimella sp. NH-Cas1]
MIVDLPSCNTRDISKQLLRLRSQVGAVTLGRVMTLIVVTDEAHADAAIDAAAEASREHPSRILALVSGHRRAASRLDAQVRVGGEAGVSELVVMRMYGELARHGGSIVTPLLLPDSAVVAWWPGAGETELAGSSVGSLAGRRITDVSLDKNPRRALARRAENYTPGDTDMAWSRTTRWRALLATALDQSPFESVDSVTVTGASDSASADLLGGWLAVRLRCPVRRVSAAAGRGLVSVRMERESGPIVLERATDDQATLTQPGHQPRPFPLPRPTTAQALSEELRHLDKDEVYRLALQNIGLMRTTSAAKQTSSSKST